MLPKILSFGTWRRLRALLQLPNRVRPAWRKRQAKADQSSLADIVRILREEDDRQRDDKSRPGQ